MARFAAHVTTLCGGRRQLLPLALLVAIYLSGCGHFQGIIVLPSALVLHAILLAISSTCQSLAVSGYDALAASFFHALLVQSIFFSPFLSPVFAYLLHPAFQLLH